MSTSEHVSFARSLFEPHSANVQWDLYAKGNTYLVRMLYNEKETAFPPPCRPTAKGSYFYRLTELERCLNR
jgi:hypothetical protein